MTEKNSPPEQIKNEVHGNLYHSSMSGDVTNIDLSRVEKIGELNRLLGKLTIDLVAAVPADAVQRNVAEIAALSRAVGEGRSASEVRNHWKEFMQLAAPFLQHLANISQIGALINSLWPR